MADGTTAIIAMLMNAGGITDLRSAPVATAAATARAQVHALVAGRIGAAGAAPRLARPNIIFQNIGVGRTYTNDGPLSLARPNLQLSCYADDIEGAKTLSSAVRRALNGFRGTADGVFIHFIMLDDDTDAPQPPPEGQERGIAGIVLMFRLACEE
jgi:hypothetical protein